MPEPKVYYARLAIFDDDLMVNYTGRVLDIGFRADSYPELETRLRSMMMSLEGLLKDVERKVDSRVVE